MLVLFGLLIAERKYSLRIGKVKDTTKVALFYNTNEEDGEGEIIRDHIELFDLSRIIKNGK